MRWGTRTCPPSAGLNEVRSPKERRPGDQFITMTLADFASTKSAPQRSGDWSVRRRRRDGGCLNEVRSPKERRPGAR